MPRMTINVRAAVWAALPLVVILTGCAAPTKSTTGTGPSPASSASKPAPKPTPTFADVTKGDSDTAAMLYSYDAAAHSAVLMPVLFMDSSTYCKTFKVKSSDPRCQREWVLEESHIKATVPVSPGVKLLGATVPGDEDQDCVGSIEKGGSCPVSLKQFKQMAKEAGNNFLVRISIEDGTITRIAEEYRP